ncbi:EIN3-binding F-box protein 1 [Abeliophyllum distichum]|uniref:EIN3-binding F-box protein 1 n=1 Tax=Abeliophyllum distichum TaxID=126358 RepID=A0ABD1Q8F1_9LAMI
MTNLALIGLQNENERGFWVMATGQGLQKLKYLKITTCREVSDLGLQAICKSCPNLCQICLGRCLLISDNGLISFAKASMSLLLMEEVEIVVEEEEEEEEEAAAAAWMWLWFVVG